MWDTSSSAGSSGDATPIFKEQVLRHKLPFRRRVALAGVLFLLSGQHFPTFARLWRSASSGGVTAVRPTAVRLAATGNAPLVDEDGFVYTRYEDREVDMDPRDAPLPPDPQEEFVGEIKSYSPAAGYGFIDCVETFSRYGHDVFLHRNQVGDLQKAAQGERVRFTVFLNKNGQPQARNLREVAKPWVDPTKVFVGKVKGFSSDRGYGFIECEDTYQIFSKDIFLHSNQFAAAGAQIGAVVTFNVMINPNGAPQARNVEKLVINRGGADIGEAEARQEGA